MKFILLITFIIAGISLSASQSELYISTGGNDAANGSKSAPLATIQKAWELIQSDTANDQFVIWLNDGRYEIDETIELMNSTKTLNGERSRNRAY